MRLPWMIWMGSNAKNRKSPSRLHSLISLTHLADFVAFVGEFVGTTMFLFFAFSGTQVANIDSSATPDSNTTTNESAGFSPIVLLYIALVFAFSLMVNVWVFFLSAVVCSIPPSRSPCCSAALCLLSAPSCW